MEPELDRAAENWQWAFDAAERALAADADVLRPETLRREARHLVEERRAASDLLRRSAVAERHVPEPWVAPFAIDPVMLGLPAGTAACVFDLDGVLTDSDAIHARAWARAIDPVLAATATTDRPFAPFDQDADYHAYFEGRLRLEGLLLFLSGRGLRLPPPEIDRILRRKAELAAASAVTPREGAHRYLQAAGLARVGRAVVSASASTRTMLGHARLDGLVEVVVDAEAIRAGALRSRPAPDTTLAACAALGAEPERTVAIVGSLAGAEAAAAAGVTVIRVGRSLMTLLDPRLRPR